MAGPALAASFPPGLLESALAVWKASVCQTGRISKLHEEVSRVLWSLGIVHTNEYITPDGLFCVDIALQDNKVCPLSLHAVSHGRSCVGHSPWTHPAFCGLWQVLLVLQ